MADGNVIKTPRGEVTINTKGSKAVLAWNPNINRFEKQYSRSQKWLDNEVLKDTTPYTPMQTGALYKSGILGTEIGSGTVQWIAPYARYLYYGKVMAGPKYGPKYPTSKDLVFSKSAHPQAQAFWFEASKAQNKQKWIRMAKKLGGGG